MIEIWKDIKGYEGLYKISNYGRVKDIRLYKTYHIKGNKIIRDYQNIRIYKKFRHNKILTPYKSPSNKYLMRNLSKNNMQTNYLIHRLVAQHFILNPDNKSCVNHKDGNKLNNHVFNLEWCSYSENIKHAYGTKLRDNNINHLKKVHKTFEKKVKISKDKFINIFNSYKECAKYLNVNPSTVSRAINKNFKCRDYTIERF